jgi:DNA-binding response OmpR family regulator
VLLARDGDQGLALIAQDPPVFVILDVGLPGGRNGFDVCREIRAKENMPVLFLTARDDEVDRILGLELGADDYLVKPFSPRELVARVRAILRRTGEAPRPPRPFRSAIWRSTCGGGRSSRPAPWWR